MATNLQNVLEELRRRHRSAATVVVAFIILDVVLLAIAYFAGASLHRTGDPSIIMGLWISILVFGLGAFVLRRTKFSALRLKDIAAVKGASALLKTLQDTTIQVASIGGAVALMGLMMTILSGDWIEMLRAAGVAGIGPVSCHPFSNDWQRAVQEVHPPEEKL